MSIFDVVKNVLQQRFRKSPPTKGSNPEQWFLDFVGGKHGDVDEFTALNNSIVFACVRILAESIATAPCHLYERQDRGKARAYDHPLYHVLHDQANPEMSAFMFFETLQGHLGTWGNAYAEIDWSPGGEVRALWPLRPDVTSPERVGGKLVYRTVIGNKGFVLPSNRVFHVPGFGYDGLVGYSPIRQAANSIGLAANAEKYGTKFFENNARPGGYLRHPGKLSDDAGQRLIKSWENRHSGLDNVNRIALLEEGMEFQTVGIAPQDAQMLQTRKFQIADIARWYRMPLHKIQEMENSTYSNIEQQAIEFVTDTLLPWFRRWESAIRTQLLTPQERKRYFAEFLIEGFLRGDTESRYKAYATARQWGWMSANDIREAENQNLLPGGQGDEYLVPMNMVSARESAKPQEDINRSSTLPLETRKKHNGAVMRLKVARNFERLFEDVATRIVRREKADIMRQAKRLLERDEQSFAVWLEEFYREAPDWMIKMFLPVLLTYTEAIQAQAASEVGTEAELTPELQEWMKGYAEIWAQNYTSASLGQLQAIIRQALEENEDVYELIEERLTEWEERRPQKVAKKETVEASNVIAKHVFAAAGFTRLRWVNTGSDVCPYCEELHGRIVGIDQPFLGKNDSLASDDGAMLIRKPAFTPPIHQGCVCQIEPV